MMLRQIACCDAFAIPAIPQQYQNIRFITVSSVACVLWFRFFLPHNNLASLPFGISADLKITPTPPPTPKLLRNYIEDALRIHSLHSQQWPGVTNSDQVWPGVTSFFGTSPCCSYHRTTVGGSRPLHVDNMTAKTVFISLHANYLRFCIVFVCLP